MTTFVFSNNATTTLAGAITNVATTALLTTGSGALFPSLGAGEQFAMTFTDAATGVLNEIVYVTAISGDTITMIRAQEGTAAKAWSAGDNASNLVTAGVMNGFSQGSLSNYVTTAELTATLASYVTSSQLATDLASYVTNTSLATTLTGYVTNSALATDLAAYPLLTAFPQQLSGSKISKKFPPLGGVNFEFQFGTVASTTGNADPITFDTAFATGCFGVIVQQDNAAGWAGNPTIEGSGSYTTTGFNLFTMKWSGTAWGFTGGIGVNYFAWGW